MKKVLLATLLFMSPTMASDQELGERLASLVTELQRVRVLNAEYRELDPGTGKYEFKYGALDRGILELIYGIESHMAAILEEEKYMRLRMTNE